MIQPKRLTTSSSAQTWQADGLSEERACCNHRTANKPCNQCQTGGTRPCQCGNALVSRVASPETLPLFGASARVTRNGRKGLHKDNTLKNKTLGSKPNELCPDGQQP